MSERSERTFGIGDDLLEQLDLLDAAELRARVDLAVALTREIRDRGLTPAEATEMLGVEQSKVSALMSGNVEGFSREHLGRLLNRLGGIDEV